MVEWCISTSPSPGEARARCWTCFVANWYQCRGPLGNLLERPAWEDCATRAPWDCGRCDFFGVEKWMWWKSKLIDLLQRGFNGIGTVLTVILLQQSSSEALTHEVVPQKETTNGRSISTGICAWPTLPSSICSTWRSLWIARLMSTFRDATRMDMTRLWWVHVGACFFFSDEAPEMDVFLLSLSIWGSATRKFMYIFVNLLRIHQTLDMPEAALLRCLKRPCNGVWWSLPMRRCWNDGASWRESTGNMVSRP